jgi:Family of unknown function (DUF6988)
VDEFDRALRKTVEEAQELRSHLLATLHSRECVAKLQSDVRLAFGYSFTHLGIQHLEGITALAGQALYLSSLALFRPMAEAHVRALWCYSCALDDELAKLRAKLSDFRFPPFKSMLSVVVERVGMTFEGPLDARTWEELCDYTHSGIRLVERSLLLQAKEEACWVEMVEAVRRAATSSGLATLAFAKLVGWANASTAMQAVVSGYLERELLHWLRTERLDDIARDTKLAKLLYSRGSIWYDPFFRK